MIRSNELKVNKSLIQCNLVKFHVKTLCDISIWNWFGLIFNSSALFERHFWNEITFYRVFSRHHPFLAAAAAARMNGFANGPPGPPGFGPPPHMMGHNPFFRPPFPHPPTDFHTPPHLLPPHPNFMGPHRTPNPFGPRPFMLMHHQQQALHHHQQQQQQCQQQNQQQPPPPLVNGGGMPNLIPNNNNSNNVPSPNCPNGGRFLQNFHQSVVGDLRAGTKIVYCLSVPMIFF